MAKGKEKSVFYCKECGYESAKWMGQCPGCRQWNTMSEERITVSSKGSVTKADRKEAVLSKMSEISTAKEERVATGMKELDRVLGGGIVPGSLTLVGGDPGIGKSTLLLEVCAHLAKEGIRVLYISGEESARQIRLRAQRLGVEGSNMTVLTETAMDAIEEKMKKEYPKQFENKFNPTYKFGGGGASGSW